ncbi:MAG TPA: FAD-dependent oxidoreductase, partial [Methanocorpusculum sp.]|nr:FAD-dependent oxidoreductase [Methanocorpusculum sp.]
GYTHQSVFSYPITGGIEALIRAIEAPVKNAILTGTEVTAVRKTPAGWEVTAGGKTYTGDRLISTIPLQVLLPMLDAPEDVRKAVVALRYNSIACISVGIRGSVPNISWMYIPEDRWGAFNRLSFPSNFSSKVAPEGCSSILAEITYNEGDDISRMSDAEIIKHTVSGLTDMGLVTDNVVHTAIDRFKYAYVVYDTEYLKNIKTVRDWIEAQGIDLVGRFSQFEYLNMDGCIRSVLNFVEKQ